MKPLKLALTAFGPFATEEVIDFRRALESRLFGIYGPTGAGKTSILDGMCFALFGESSGDERQGTDLRSHHASPDVETEVRLIFEVGAKRYHVVRRPRQEGRAKRGGGLTVRQHYAALYDVTGFDLDDIDAENPGLVLEERRVELVAERLTDLLGYTAAQFRQVVLLPQGQFRQLLTAGSDQRSAILRGLFDVSVYERFVDKLKADASELKAEVEQGRTQIATWLEAHGVTDADALKRLIEEDEAKVGQCSEAVGSAEAKQTAAREALESAKEAAAALNELKTAADEVKRLEDGRAAAAEALQRAEAAEAARGCAPVRLALTRADELAARAETAWRDAEQGAAEAETKAATAAEELAASIANQAERDSAASRVSSLATYAEKVAGAGELRTSADEATKKLQTAERELAAATSAREAAAAADQAAGERVRIAQRDATLRARIQLRIRDLESEQAVAQARRRHEAAVENLAKRRGSAVAKLDEARAAADTARLAEQELEAALVSSQAAQLARKLEEGQPCPVCGGRDHPAPAAAGLEDAALEARWRAARKVRETAEAAERAAADAVTGLAGEGRQLAAAGAELATEGRSLADVEAEIGSARAELGELGEDEVSDFEARAETLHAEHDEAIEREKRAKLAVEARNREALEATTALATALDGVPLGLQDAAAIEQEIGGARARLKQLNEAHELLLTSERAASDASRKARQAVESAIEHLNERRSELEQAREDWARALLEAGFDESRFQAASADIEAAAALREQARGHAEALAAALDRHARAATAAHAIEAPDLEALAALLEERDAEVASAVAEHSQASLLLSQRRDAATAIGEAASLLGERERRFATVGQLAQTCDGRNSRNLRLRDYAVAATFEAILDAANLRFSRMSRGRFALIRKDHVSDGRTRSGLEIEVFDAHTDQKRDAHTLSGGEGFLASLALALGLSDVVQAEAGGVKLDAIFIDEGFGHLDDETLDVALDTLRDMVGRERAVGVISHVDAVKHQIAAGFDVSRTKAGSAVSERIAA